jgi:hypothetical protein
VINGSLGLTQSIRNGTVTQLSTSLWFTLFMVPLTVELAVLQNLTIIARWFLAVSPPGNCRSAKCQIQSFRVIPMKFQSGLARVDLKVTESESREKGKNDHLRPFDQNRD